MTDHALARRLRRLPRARVLGYDVPVATDVGARLLGLALLDPAETGSGLLIPRCSSVHTFGMRLALDVLFLDDRGALISARRCVPRGRFVSDRRAAAVLELPAGRSGPHTSEGDKA